MDYFKPLVGFVEPARADLQGLLRLFHRPWARDEGRAHAPSLSVELEQLMMSWVLYRDDGAPLGCVLRLHGGEATYAYTTTGALRRLGACSTDDGGQARGRARGRDRGGPRLGEGD